MEDFPPTQVIISDDEEVPEEPFDEGDSLSPPRIIRRQNAFKAPRKGIKRPYVEPVRYPSDDEDQPDLKEYFSQWDMKDRDIIIMCRSYASYLDRTSKANKKDY